MFIQSNTVCVGFVQKNSKCVKNNNNLIKKNSQLIFFLTTSPIQGIKWFKKVYTETIVKNHICTFLLFNFADHQDNLNSTEIARQ